ncbi:unnamed protein product [Chilo suppressalis]|uniref:Protein sleepless n=1 Tax=Chilo suppressalis TaxID=168631 RepID=A0ABN8AX43_CHISP|nr:hypothetical protein evm_003002 [Chilo suppressalis]CAH0400835.1 unnamed protein product [Chilo suppressalis]
MAMSLFVPVLLLAAYVQYGESVRCWTCSSDLNPHCADPFLVGGGIDNTYFRLENCDANTGATYPYLTSSKSACKKQKKYINGLLVISRGCTWKRQDDFTNTCPSSSNGPNEVTYSCETCEYDGCNGAATIGKTIALMLAPLGLLLFK